MKENDAAGRQFRQPRVEVVLHGFVGMKAVNVEEVDRAFVELSQGVVEQAAVEPNVEGGVVLLDDLADDVDDFLAVEAGVLLTLPRVDGMQPGFEATVFYGLGKGEEGDAVVRAELYDAIRSPVSHEIVGKPPVPRPWPCAPFRVRQVCLELRRAKGPRLS